MNKYRVTFVKGRNGQTAYTVEEYYPRGEGMGCSENLYYPQGCGG